MKQRKKQPTALEKEIQASAFAIGILISNIDDLEVTFSTDESITLYWKNLRIDTDKDGLYRSLMAIHELVLLQARFE